MSEEIPPSELVAGKYRLTRLLGRGGMGSVWEGVHSTLGNRVACKFIEPEYMGSVDAVTRFENEARAAASLKSKHVVDVYDHGVMPDGRPYIVMEFLEGEPLDARLSRVGALSLPETATIIQQVSRALYRAHSAGIIHRDLKPENIFLVWDDEDQTDIVKVVDFGIAKFTDSSTSGVSSATRTGSIMGTPYYMSPEQARGLKNVDARADNWSLGVIAYEALTGYRPFDGEAVGDILVKICTSPPIPPSQVQPQLPEAVDVWMQKALSVDPSTRFQDVRELSDSLTTLAGAPGRTTLGSAVNPELGAVVAPSASNEFATHRRGTPDDVKKSSGALTNAAVETAVAELPVRKSSMFVWGGAAALLVAVGIGVALSGGSEPDASADAASDGTADRDKPAADQPALVPQAPIDQTPPHLPQPEASRSPEPTPELEPTTPPSDANTPEVVATKTPPVPKAAPKAQPHPAPRPVVRPSPAPQAAPPPPAPRPAPTPSNSNLDLGY